jgi:RND family efflux transporter MFP subunit
MKSRIVVLALVVAAVVGYVMLRDNPVVAKRLNSLHPRTEQKAAPVAAETPASIRAEGRPAAYPGAEVLVSAERRGILESLTAQERQMVHKGQMIAELRSRDLDAQISEERAKLAEIEADIRLYESEAARYRTLYEEKVGTRQAQEKAERDLDLARARLGTEQAAITELETERDKTRIVAPISGMVLLRNRQQGESVDAGETIVTIADLKRVRVEAEVDEFDLARVKPHAPVVIHAEGFDRTWRGHVEEIPDEVEGRKLKPEDPGKPTDTRVLLVKVAFDEPSPLKLGQRVEVDFR